MVKSLKREEPGKEEKEPGKFAKMKKTLSEGIRKCGKGAAGGVAVLAALGMLAGCGDTKDYVPNIPDGQTDGDVDGSVNTDKDLDAGVDGDVDIDGSVDAGPDADVDAGVDAGPDVDLDAGVDAGVDGDVDIELPCVGVTDETVTVTDTVLFRDDPFEVGGYTITHIGAPLNAALANIKCGSTAEDVATEVKLPVGKETVIEVEVDGKKITVYVHARCSGYMVADVTVGNL